MLTAFLALFVLPRIAAAQTTPVSEQPVGGIRIAWDHGTLKKVSSNPGRYAGYARVVQLFDGSLFCVYEADGSIVSVKSTDLGESWSAQAMIAPKDNGVNMSVPDILQLADHSLLVCYNPRPQRGNDTSKHFAIKTKRSTNGGQTWADERTLYQADSKFENGCWEPSAIQLPNGEIQLFFANEGIYLTSNEQNISMVRSGDGGLSWSARPQMVSFRPHSRDGMPSPLLLQNGKEIVFSIEDNGFKNFKPYIIRSAVKDNWATVVGANSPDRDYALADKIPDSIYAGAPYLRQLRTGETILSYQGTEGRINNMNHADMKVAIGDANARNFSRKTAPFELAGDRSGLWSSLSVLNDNTVVALTSTSNYNTSHRAEIWMIKGHIIPELTAKKHTMKVYGKSDDTILKDGMPVFIGQKGPANLRAGMTYDDKNLYLFARVADSATNRNGIMIELDPQNKSYDSPGKGIFKITIKADNKLTIAEGDKGGWAAISNTAGLRSAIAVNDAGYDVAVAIPWQMIGGKPKLNTRIGVNLALVENAYTENISANEADKPFTWCTLKLY